MQKSPQKNNGCLWIFIFGFMSMFGWVFLQAFFSIPSTIAGIVAMIVSAVLTTKWLGRPSVKGLLLNISLIVGVLFALNFLGEVFTENITLPKTEDKTFKTEEGVVSSKIWEENDSVPVYTSHRIWKDNYGNNYFGDLTIREKDHLSLKNHLKTYSTQTNENFWGNLYKYVDTKDTPKLDLVMKTFQDIHAEKQLNQMEFAEMVVTCIQDIPYSFIFQTECLPAENYETSIRRILQDCPECCMGNVFYGLQTPTSFLQNLKGDCDTRTVIIYSILKHFDYDVAILNSTFYRHSIIGINLPTKGEGKVYKGKKYAVWETTAKYYEAGSLPNSFKDITHWEVVLTSK